MVLAAKSGVGLAALPSVVGDNDRDLVRVLGPVKGLVTPFFLLAHEDLRQMPRIRAFFDFVVEELPTIRGPLFTGEAQHDKKQKK